MGFGQQGVVSAGRDIPLQRSGICNKCTGVFLLTTAPLPAGWQEPAGAVDMMLCAVAVTLRSFRRDKPQADDGSPVTDKGKMAQTLSMPFNCTCSPVTADPFFHNSAWLMQGNGECVAMCNGQTAEGNFMSTAIKASRIRHEQGVLSETPA